LLAAVASQVAVDRERRLIERDREQQRSARAGTARPPARPPAPLQGAAVAAVSQAEGVGGDFYNFIRLPELGDAGDVVHGFGQRSSWR
jgi:hypothetical protein